ncbi:hypothetical protein NKR23_g12444 [Pleurostoma richardsiae]|uniref:Uncharacterized protein n=1 Tax=Pleurostoma richardsiae TaxID=41990 RepID=A0AA38VFG5_9PEZI|nr:hypothetical protein NKR23_g12444 [Pleurostoma richardsiae]
MTQTILDVLVSPNPELDSSFVTEGTNTTSQEWLPVTAWQPWTDLNYDDLLSMFGNSLFAEWNNPPVTHQGWEDDHRIHSEKCLDLFLAKFLFPTVNGAFRRASEVLGWAGTFYIGSGSCCYGTGPPDWGLVSDQYMDGNKHWNLMPGDTKLHAKWRPSMAGSKDPYMRQQWSLAPSQVQWYAINADRAVGFIITDENLVALRFSKEPDTQSSANTRPRRAVSQQLHQRVASGSTDISSVLDSMSLDSFEEGSYIDNNPQNVEYQPPEYVVVPWAAQGRGQLTIKLVLYCLGLMAGGGPGNLRHDYPPLNSWRQEGDYFIHNTSGLMVKTLPRDALLVDPNPAASGEYQPQQEAGPSKAAQEQDFAEGGGDGEGGSKGAGEGEGREASREGHRKEKREVRSVKVTKKHGHYSFTNANGKEIKTKRADWARSTDPDGWVYETSKHVYFAERLP